MLLSLLFNIYIFQFYYMKFKRLVLLLLFLLSYSYSNNKIIYLEPCPGAALVSTDNNIIIGFEKQINLGESEILNNIIVTGSRGMTYDGIIFISDNGKKIIFKPIIPFQPDEEVNVKIKGNLSKSISASNNGFSFSFKTSIQKIQWDPLKSLKDGINTGQNYKNLFSPPGPPSLTVTVDNNPASGDIFLSNFSLGNIRPYLIIANNHGSMFWYSLHSMNCYDFKKQPNGHLTYFNNADFKYYEIDTTYQIVNNYQCGNGYTTDLHELRVLNNGHAFLMAYDPEIVDMSQIVPGGNPHAQVIGLIIQELDVNKNVVFQWRSWDHFAITDAWHENLLASNIDYVHGNALEIDNDSNIILSSRHLDEVTKINHNTGAIIWRFGGKNNQFTFTGDTLKFTYQHAIRRIANGNLTLFDNGNFHTPHFSRAVEYSVDEVNKVANVVWEYRHTPDIFGEAMGYVQRLSNGNTLVSWGLANPTVSEVTPNKTVVFEMSLPPSDYSYRVCKDSWNGTPVLTYNNQEQIVSSFKLYQNYPNPFNPTTNISYQIPKGSFVKLSVYDILGREVATLVNTNQNAGEYEVEWNANNFSSGVYFYKIQADYYTSTRKMTLVK